MGRVNTGARDVCERRTHKEAPHQEMQVSVDIWPMCSPRRHGTCRRLLCGLSYAAHIKNTGEGVTSERT